MGVNDGACRCGGVVVVVAHQVPSEGWEKINVELGRWRRNVGDGSCLS